MVSKIVSQILSDLRAFSSEERRISNLRFFKTGPGQYGEGDQFLGITVPDTRLVAKKWKGLDLDALTELLQHQFHEARLCALIIMVEQFKKAEEAARKALYELYLREHTSVNNWDLVDTSASVVVGLWCMTHPTEEKTLTSLLKSKVLWDRRIAVLATFPYIKKGDGRLIVSFAKQLLSDKEDLMHKAVGWMLRELGKTNLQALLQFLDTHASAMPRTMLRYAIERLTPVQKSLYMQAKG